MPAPKSSGSRGKTARASSTSSRNVGDGIASLAEQLVNRVIKPLDLVMLTRERIQETLDEAAERGRVTRADANELASELFNRGRQQTDALVADIERLLGRGRSQLGAATRRAREPVDRIFRSGDRADSDPSLPIAGYDDLTARQVQERLTGLSAPELRRLREYERRHANRKSVLTAIERVLA
jgi:polyhydroxyalkanoate synthesis regulator phasin